ncbi:hypothetical protein ACFSJY_17540 [Thalassotalea euphylliae]|uniref:hypothetical protein n=1 Tax=Thalassotalea euphylliae TaxID=1655234 RepID=UPI00362A46CA
MKKGILSISIAVALLTGCAATVKPVDIPQVSNLKGIEANSTDVKAYISDFSINLPSPKIGQAKTGTLCVGGTDLTWTGHTPTVAAMDTTVKSTFKDLNYNVSSSLLKEKARNEANVLIAGSVTDMKGNLCLSIDGQKGDVYAEVSWELYNKKNDQTLTLKTQGTSSNPKFVQAGDTELFVASVKMATLNLLANPEVHKLLNN